jgi:hypothetical protein
MGFQARIAGLFGSAFSQTLYVWQSLFHQRSAGFSMLI